MDDAQVRSLLDRANADIARVGWHAVGVFPSKDEGSVGFTYTVGLDPEILIIGLEVTRAHGIAARLVEVAAEQPPAPGEVHVLGGGMRVRLDAVPVEQAERLLTLAKLWRVAGHGPRRFEVVQVVWPDPAGVLPGEDGCDPRYARQQAFGSA